jgi:alanyl-tRNA synthetase
LKTEKLYHYDSYQKTFQASIVDKYLDKGKYAVILNQTCFYPTSGGQICDKGFIENIPVIDVEENNERIIHYLENEIIAGIGELVTGTIDWQHRFDHMQQHTGQHILSGALIKLWQKETQSFHMGMDICTVDIPAMVLDEQKIDEIEQLVNKIISENRQICHYYLKNRDELINYRFRDKQEKLEQLRIIAIEDFDRSACGGTHCQKTGEVGLIKITGWENRKDKTRISFLCGFRALSDYQQKHRIIKNLSNFFTTGIENLEEKIIRLNQEQKELSKLYSKMERKIIEQESEELKEKNRREEKGLFLIEKLFLEQKVQNVRQIAFLLSKEEKTVIILGAEKPEPTLCIACSVDINYHIKEILNQVMAEFKGKGGGSDYMVLGKLKREEDVKKACQRVAELIPSFSL